MKGGAADTDDYLADWRKGEPTECGDDMEAEAQIMADKLEADFDVERLRALIHNGGNES